MALFILILVVLVIAFFVWAPWSRATYFEKKISVQYSKWEGPMGGCGQCVYIYIKEIGTYHVKVVYNKNTTDVKEKITIEEDYIIDQETIDTAGNTVLRVIDIDDDVTFVTVDINNEKLTESHTLRIGGLGA